MKFLWKVVLVILMLASFSSCASVSKSKWPLTINTNPSGAKLEITNKRGLTVYSGTTPAIVKLKSGAGFFVPASYQVKLSMDGYAEKVFQVGTSLNGWYVGNLLFGGLIGLLIVDPATGAMYKLDTDYINETLSKSTDKITLNIIDINNMPSDMRDHLVLVK
jgi:hypothetical protein